MGQKLFYIPRISMTHWFSYNFLIYKNRPQKKIMWILNLGIQPRDIIYWTCSVGRIMNHYRLIQILLSKIQRIWVIGSWLCNKTITPEQWWVSNFIPMGSKKFAFWNLDYIIRYSLKNESKNRKNEVTWGHVTLWILNF